MAIVGPEARDFLDWACRNDQQYPGTWQEGLIFVVQVGVVLIKVAKDIICIDVCKAIVLHTALVG